MFHCLRLVVTTAVAMVLSEDIRGGADPISAFTLDSFRTTKATSIGGGDFDADADVDGAELLD